MNECHLKLHDCDSESSCVNTEGSFYCKCDDGFEIDELKKCHGKMLNWINESLIKITVSSI